MASFLPKINSRYSVRSASFSARSHSTSLRIEKEIQNLKSLEASSSASNAETICTRLSSLGELYMCINGLLNLSLTQQALSQNQHEKWVSDLLDGSVRYLDICSKTRDAVSLMKENVRRLQSALRRSKGGKLSIESDLASYICSRKRVKKEAAKSLAALKQMDNKVVGSPLLKLDNDHLSYVVKVVREASLATISIFSSLLIFLSMPMLKRKVSRWSLVSKLVHKEVVPREWQEQSMNELGRVDIALGNLLMHNSGKCLEEESVESAHEKLEVLDGCVDGLENGLECLFRHLIHDDVLIFCFGDLRFISSIHDHVCGPVL